MKKTSIIFFLLINFATVKGIDLQNNKGAESMGAANTFLFHQNCFSSVQSAYLIPNFTQNEIGISFQNSYFLKDVNSLLISAALPFRKNFGAGVSASFFGNQAYQLFQNNISLALKTNNNFSFHLGGNFNYLTVINYGNTREINIQGGMHYKFNSKFEIALSVYNPFESKLKYNNQVEINSLSSYSLGCLFKPNKNIDLMAEINHLNNRNNIKTAIVYKINPNFKILLGVATLSPSFNFGFTYKVKKISFSFANQTNQRIGLSSNLGISYQFLK